METTLAPIDDSIDVIIVGAGISGLLAARELSAHHTVRVLEARSRVGGRLLSTMDGVDLGASWWWSHDDSAQQLARELGVASVAQHLAGNAWIHRPGRPAERIGDVGDQIVPCGPGSRRFVGGYAELATRLASELPEGIVQLDCRVIALERHQPCDGAPHGVRVLVDGGRSLCTRSVIVAVPPRIASAVSFVPSLERARAQLLRSVATWCGDWSKVVVSFREPFWRARGDSGAAATPGGLVDAWWEASGGAEAGEASASLAGIAFGVEAARRLRRLGTPAPSDACAPSGACAPTGAPSR